MNPVVALHPSLRLRRTGSNHANSQLVTHAPKLRERRFSPQLLGLGCLALVHVLPVGIESPPYPILLHPGPQHSHRRPDRFFFPQTGLRRARSIVHHDHQATSWSTPFQPLLETPVQLHQLPKVPLAFPSSTVFLASSFSAPPPCLQHPQPQGVVIHHHAVFLR